MEYISNECPVCGADISEASLEDLLLKGCPECGSLIVTREDYKWEVLLQSKKITE